MTTADLDETRWRTRIVGHGEESPDQLLAHPGNYRIHPKGQQAALEGLLNQVGWVQNVIVNRTTGRVVDGHLRVSLALTRREPTIPVVYVELTEDEESLVLASLDPLAAMAVTDDEALRVLLDGVVIQNDALSDLLSSIVRPLTPFTFPTPTQDEINQRQEDLESSFVDRQKELLARLIPLICPECGAEFSLAADEILKDQGNV